MLARQQKTIDNIKTKRIIVYDGKTKKKVLNECERGCVILAVRGKSSDLGIKIRGRRNQSTVPSYWFPPSRRSDGKSNDDDDDDVTSTCVFQERRRSPIRAFAGI